MTVSSANDNPGPPQAGGYAPAPRDTSGVCLTDDILALTEEMAKNTHEIWAQQRLAEGWRYGPCRDDARQEHPGLVPYEALAQSEKDYDRNTALETIRLILSLGYEIVPARRSLRE